MNKNVKTYSISARHYLFIYLFCLTWCTRVTKTKINKKKTKQNDKNTKKIQKLYLQLKCEKLNKN